MQVENEARKNSRRKVCEEAKVAKALQRQEGSDYEDEEDERQLTLELSGQEEQESSQDLDEQPLQPDLNRGRHVSESSSCTLTSGTQSFAYRDRKRPRGPRPRDRGKRQKSLEEAFSNTGDFLISLVY